MSFVAKVDVQQTLKNTVQHKQRINAPIRLPKTPKKRQKTPGSNYSPNKAILRKNFSRLLLKQQPLLEGQPIEPATVYAEIARLPMKEICDIFFVYLYKGKTYRRSRSIFLKAASYWPNDALAQFFKESASRHMQFRLDLMNQILIPRYIRSKDLNIILQALPILPTSSPERASMVPTTSTSAAYSNALPLYNAALNATQKSGEFEHMEHIFQLMQERHIPLDAASYNIMIDAKLTSHKDSLLPKDIYDGLLTKLFVPTQATFHIFIKHDIERQNWKHLAFWLDTMKEHQMKPNRVTHRLLFKALAKYPNETVLIDLIDRLTVSTTTSESEKQSFPTSLLQGIPENAADILQSAYKVSQPIYAFNLLLKFLCEKGSLKLAKQVLDMMSSIEALPKPDMVSFTTMFHGILRHKHHIDIDHVNSVYDELKQQGKHSNVLQAVTFYGTLKSNNYQNVKEVLNKFESLLGNSQTHSIQDNEANENDAEQTELDAMTIYNMMIDFYFVHHHKSEHLRDKIPVEVFNLLHEATERKGLRPDVSTLNIMIRGLALFHGDLIAADKLLQAFDKKGIKMDERTCWYLVSAAFRKGNISTAIQYIKNYENMGGSIKGSGLKDLRNTLLK
ncbi:hypothetical protein BDF20DRAFT_917358 [Mycotypha africana]|uniref:uncharacterized protein n=1 Tax=Mycotypha africana TaxID=64632 RepID=UPI002300241D|nr:uncharacterized protein BDF20DRAFT_917358 [Mycotypha africana]KAI8967756.1 hypothetical protein BDF20DRAFT_917358 [Mycotypha africana]